jgi:hypothetical protein
LGKVEDIGRRAGTLLPALGELTTLSSRDPNSLSVEEKRRLLELQREHAKLLGALPEIARFQDSQMTMDASSAACCRRRRP